MSRLNDMVAALEVATQSGVLSDEQVFVLVSFMEVVDEEPLIAAALETAIVEHEHNEDWLARMQDGDYGPEMQALALEE